MNSETMTCSQEEHDACGCARRVLERGIGIEPLCPGVIAPEVELGKPDYAALLRANDWDV